MQALSAFFVTPNLEVHELLMLKFCLLSNISYAPYEFRKFEQQAFVREARLKICKMEGAYAKMVWDMSL